MSLFGMGKGLVKIATGVVELDPKKVLKGIVQTTGNAIGEVIRHTFDEDTGQTISTSTNVAVDGEDAQA